MTTQPTTRQTADANSPGFRIVIGSDDAGYEYRHAFIQDLRDDPRVAWVRDLGVDDEERDTTPYPDVAVRVGEAIAAGEADRGVLICGTGIGVAISANKVPGIRATVAHDSYSVERSILSNDCQILTVGQRVIGLELARRLVSEWLGYVFDPSSPSKQKVARITAYEHQQETGAT
jgi:ribose 5-phosphate isomerase B